MAKKATAEPVQSPSVSDWVNRLDRDGIGSDVLTCDERHSLAEMLKPLVPPPPLEWQNIGEVWVAIAHGWNLVAYPSCDLVDAEENAGFIWDVVGFGKQGYGSWASTIENAKQEAATWAATHKTA